jgi:hypothetical protein
MKNNRSLTFQNKMATERIAAVLLLCAQILTLHVQLCSQKNYGQRAKLLALHRGTVFCI